MVSEKLIFVFINNTRWSKIFIEGDPTKRKVHLPCHLSQVNLFRCFPVRIILSSFNFAESRVVSMQLFDVKMLPLKRVAKINSMV